MSGPGELWDRTGAPVEQVLPTVEDTEELGRRLASLLRAGDLLVLSGPLGAGKTALVRGLGEALGVAGRVTSPTFVLARQHRGPLPLLHVDAYRLRDAGTASLDDLDLEDALADGVAAVEWGEGLVEGVTDSWLEVTLVRDDDDVRRAQVRPHGPRWE
ncbi:MAG: hypothetical protein JWO60_2746 [Frankiales bacterium]|nr:hypothetical protein [Frankiales bacterium]